VDITQGFKTGGAGFNGRVPAQFVFSALSLNTKSGTEPREDNK
jgi:hypothetical protein